MKKFLIITIVLSLIAPLFFGCDTDENEIRKENSPVSLKWRNETGFRGGALYNMAAPVVVDDMIFVGCQYDYLYCFDKNTGQTIWRFYMDDVFINSPTVVDGVVYVGGWSCKYEGRKLLFAIHAENGKLKWRIKLEEDTPPETDGLGDLTVVDGVIFVGSIRGNVYAVEAESGKLKWSFKTNDKIIMTTPSVHKGVVYYVSGYYLNAIDAETGELKWRNKPGDLMTHSSCVFNGLIYVEALDSTIHAIGAEDSEKKWCFKMDHPSSTPCTVLDGVLYFGSLDSFLYALDPSSGKLKWRFKTGSWSGSWIDFPPTLADDGVLYVASSDHYLYAIYYNSGLLKWKYKTEYRVYSKIVVEDDSIYFGGGDGYIYALELKEQ